eukprot:tig00000113_g5571.t1
MLIDEVDPAIEPLPAEEDEASYEAAMQVRGPGPGGSRLKLSAAPRGPARYQSLHRGTDYDARHVHVHRPPGDQKKIREQRRRRTVHWGLPAIVEFSAPDREPPSPRSRRSKSMCLPRPLKSVLCSGAVSISGPAQGAGLQLATDRPLPTSSSTASCKFGGFAAACRLPAVTNPSGPAPAAVAPSPYNNYEAPKPIAASIAAPRSSSIDTSIDIGDLEPRGKASAPSNSWTAGSRARPPHVLTCPRMVVLAPAPPPLVLAVAEPTTTQLTELAGTLLSGLGLDRDPLLLDDREAAPVPPSLAPPKPNGKLQLAPLSPSTGSPRPSSSAAAGPHRPRLSRSRSRSRSPTGDVDHDYEASARRDPSLPPPKPQLPVAARGRPVDLPARRTRDRRSSPSGSGSPSRSPSLSTPRPGTPHGQGPPSSSSLSTSSLSSIGSAGCGSGSAPTTPKCQGAIATKSPGPALAPAAAPASAPKSQQGASCSQSSRQACGRGLRPPSSGTEGRPKERDPGLKAPLSKVPSLKPLKALPLLERELDELDRELQEAANGRRSLRQWVVRIPVRPAAASTSAS